MKLIHNQAYTCAAASLTGHASNVTGASWTIATTSAGDNLGHQVTVRNDSVTDHSGKTILLTGTALNDAAQTETIAAPGTSATVTSTLFFKTLTAAAPSATIGADTFDIGWTATAQTPWVFVSKAPSVCAVSVGGTINFDIQHRYEDEGSTPTVFDSEAAKTASIEHVYTQPVRAVRVDVNSHTSGTFTMIVAE